MICNDRLRGFTRFLCLSVLPILIGLFLTPAKELRAEPRNQRPNIILVMADDQGWGETGYAGHPRLKTPHLDAMAASGLRLDRFYAGAPVCSPTRAAVLTGRSPVRAGVPEHGHALRHQEITLASLLAESGYQTAHFGKWHLNGLRGPGVPIFRDDPFHPGTFGFQTWLSVTNFFDRDPLLGRMGKIEAYEGDSSDVIVEQALEHVARQVKDGRPFFNVIWYGTPHSPFKASEEDCADFADLNEKSKHHYGELVALDRSVGAIRKRLRELEVERQTLFWYCSDNGGLPGIKPETVGGLRGNKGTIYEGGLRVPGILEWPGSITPRVSDYPASVMDILPTVLELAEQEFPSPNRVLDGESLTPLFDREQDPRRAKPIGFRYRKMAALIDNEWKILTTKVDQADSMKLYQLATDKAESEDVSKRHPKRYRELEALLNEFLHSTDASIAGEDYPSGEVDADHPQPKFWTDRADYRPYLDEWQTRWQYSDWIRKRR
ncbi:MAG: sulfatase-like hydrolase/transferase [Planctomycetota bacterium]